MTWTDDGATSESSGEAPNEAKLRRDIRHFEHQIAQLASPHSAWERGALNCYQVLVKERRKMLDDMKSSELSTV